MNKTLPKLERDYLLSLEEVKTFLCIHLNSEVKEINEIKKGKYSQAFSYTLDKQEFVIRFNTHNRGFLKEIFVSNNYPDLKSPSILDTGKLNKQIYYSISRKLVGETLHDQYHQNNFSSIPILLDYVESIKDSPITQFTGYGEWDPHTGNATYATLYEYLHSKYYSNDHLEWDPLFKLAHFDKKFTDYLASKIMQLASFSENTREFLHGDIGADNVFIQNSTIEGVIDWEGSKYADHFFDIARILYFCPNRTETGRQAVNYYESKDEPNWKERILLGVYLVVLTNYGFAARINNKLTCKKTPERLRELEDSLSIKSL